jgi:hypothetical protein
MDWKKFISLKIVLDLIVVSPTINVGDTVNSKIKVVLTAGLNITY